MQAAAPRPDSTGRVSAEQATTTPLRQVALPAAPIQPARSEAGASPALEDLRALLALLDAPRERDLLLEPETLERLFRPPARQTDPGPYADWTRLDLVGDAEPEALGVISNGWFGSWLVVCAFERVEAGWRLVASRRLEGTCRGLPTVELERLDERRWIRLEWADRFGTGLTGTALALLEPVAGELVVVLRTTRDGRRVGGGSPVSVSYQLQEFELARAGDAIAASLSYGLSAVVDEALGLGEDLVAGEDFSFAFRQPAPGALFELLDPATRGGPELALFAELAAEVWLEQHVELASRLAQEGTRAQQLALLDLVEGMLDHGSPPQARTLIALLPPRAALEAPGPGR